MGKNPFEDQPPEKPDEEDIKKALEGVEKEVRRGIDPIREEDEALAACERELESLRNRAALGENVDIEVRALRTRMERIRRIKGLKEDL